MHIMIVSCSLRVTCSLRVEKPLIMDADADVLLG